jgi:hypothetical protein
MIKLVQNLEGEPIYHVASSLIQTVIMRKQLEEFVKSGFKDLDDVYDFMTSCQWTPTFNCCFQNALYEYKQNGGTLVFGSMGWKKKSSSDVHWEYGGPDYTVSKFLKKA